MKFNLHAAKLTDRVRIALVPRLMLRQWWGYQVRRCHIAYLPAYRRCRERKPVIRSVVEAVLLAARWRCLPFHYLRYGLYDRSFELRNIMDYLPETVLYYRLL